MIAASEIGCVSDTVFPEFLEQTVRYFVSTAVFGNILAHYKDGIVAFHLFCQRFFKGIAIGNRLHQYSFSVLGCIL